ncbi:hypothetical protein [Deinococcus sp.]|uniref:hypothetical protein n=1 Tax=Deinococcus sp. TaxID=47478 RepID=UPI0025DC3882|nr:hypothetical protein [Deinococcus sp.]
MKAPGVQTGRGTLSLAFPLGFLHLDGQPVTLENAAKEVRTLTARITERTKALRTLEAQGRACDPLLYAELTREAQMDAHRVRAWSALEALGLAAVGL